MIQHARRQARSRPIRYAVVGLGAIAQTSVLPAFANCRRAELVALITDDPVKAKTLARKYRISHVAGYDGYEQILRAADIDAVYICLPNHLHREYCERAARVGVHVLCEKPLATSSADGEAMIRTCAAHGVKLMVAYRLHLEKANLTAIKTVRDGRIGDPRCFTSSFSFQVRPGDIRVRAETGGGVLWDLGVYCINAARFLFRAEPIEALAFVAGDDQRFAEVEASASALLRFPGERTAAFTASFAASAVDAWRLVGAKGDLALEHGYEYAAPMTLRSTIGGKTTTKTFPIRDQFGPEIDYFADCIHDGCEPEPSGAEGLADVRIIECLYRSAREGIAVPIPRLPMVEHPSPDQAMTRPAVPEPRLIHAREPSIE